MNILPKKSWHVLKKENIERVRRDEAKAAEEEKQKQARIALAEQEARTSRLREKARKRYDDTLKESSHLDELAVVQVDDQPKGHINFFKDIQEGKNLGGVNADHEAEKEAEKIEYEKKIGLLTYLGQSSAESQTVKPWYLCQDSKRKSSNETDSLLLRTSTVDLKRKKLMDPMEDMNRYLGKKSDSCTAKKANNKLPVGVEHPAYTPNVEEVIKVKETCHRKGKKRKHKKHRKYNTSSDDSDSEKQHKKNKSKHKKKHHRKHRHKSSSSSVDNDHSSNSDNQQRPSKSGVSIEKLRAERLKREAAEKARADRLIFGKTEESPPSLMSVPEKVENTRGRYNSQFHPELARKRHQRNDFHL